MERVCVTLATGVSGHVSDRTGKDKETLKAVLAETPARTNAKGVQCELRSESVRVQKPKTRVVALRESVRVAGCRVASVVKRSSC